MKVFLTVVAVLLALLGITWLLSPGIMLGSWDVQTDATGVYLGRRLGVMALGFACILWLSRGAGPSAARAAILVGGAFVTAVITLVSLAGVITGTIGPGAWVSVAIEALLAAGFIYFALAGRTQSGGAQAS